MLLIQSLVAEKNDRPIDLIDGSINRFYERAMSICRGWTTLLDGRPQAIEITFDSRARHKIKWI